MSVRTVPLAGGADLATQTQRTALDGRDYLLTLQWNARAGAWYLDLADQDEVVIVAGVRLVPGFPLLRGVIDSRRPPGELYLLDLESVGDLQRAEHPTLDSIGTRHALVYMDADELAGVAS